MNEIVLRSHDEKGVELTATYLPDRGLNLASYKLGNIEIIDQSTRADFEDHFAGLGAMIGPHFYRRHPSIIPKIKDESLFPHISRVRAKGGEDPFSHGIGRYAPWKVEATPTTLKGVLTGKDLWQGVPLAELEGHQFQMRYEAQLTSLGLKIEMSVVSEVDSIVGIHHYYRLPGGRGKVIASVQDDYFDPHVMRKIPPEWIQNGQLLFDLNESADFAFHPFPDPLVGLITLETDEYRLKTAYTSPSQENAWQLYHPKGASFVCIEPVSAQDPRHANLTASSITILLTIDALAGC